MDPILAYRVAFNHVHGIGAVRTGKLCEYFGSLEAAWKASGEDLRRAGLPLKAIESLVAFRGKNDPYALTQNILDRHFKIAIPEDDEYPRLLKEIDNPPPVLYYVGTLPKEDEQLLAVVGTRRITSYGENTCRNLGRLLPSHGISVVSGLARGVDGAIHSRILENGGRTYAVLGSGLSRIYPPEHRNLAREIVRHGAVISEYAPEMPPDKVNFPQRNRIISGMCSACLVVEAGEKSGSLITARFAAEQGREVFAVPGEYDRVLSAGTNQLINQGAQMMIEPKVILDFYNSWQSAEPEKQPRPIQASFLTPEDSNILAAVELEPLHVNEIARRTGIPVERVMQQAILLELQDLIRETSPQTYEKVREWR